MKLTRYLSLLVFPLALAFSAHAAVDSGKAAPDFELKDLKGQVHHLSDYKGKTVVLEWVNPQCPFVKHHYEAAKTIPTLQAEAKAAGIVWLSINSGHPGAEGDLDPAAVAAWQAKTGATPTAYFRDSDGKVGKLYGAKTTPHIFIINAEGNLVYQGAIDDKRGFSVADTLAATNHVRATLAALKAGQPVSPASTPPYGCGVKY
jgi:hypothetical protein